jgi:hypothetical protein
MPPTSRAGWIKRASWAGRPSRPANGCRQRRSGARHFSPDCTPLACPTGRSPTRSACPRRSSRMRWPRPDGDQRAEAAPAEIRISPSCARAWPPASRPAPVHAVAAPDDAPSRAWARASATSSCASACARRLVGTRLRVRTVAAEEGGDCLGSQGLELGRGVLVSTGMQGSGGSVAPRRRAQVNCSAARAASAASSSPRAVSASRASASICRFRSQLLVT